MHILMPIIEPLSFVQDDITRLQKVHQVRTMACRTFGQMLHCALSTRKADVLLCWFGSIRFLPAACVARVLGKRIVVISGGYDVASEPSFGYGNMLHRVTRLLGRTLFRLTHRVASISYAAADEAVANAGVDRQKIRVIYLGLDANFGAGAPEWISRGPVVLTVGQTNSSSIVRKGIATLLRASRELPEARFVFAGPVEPAVQDFMTQEAGTNVTLVGRVSKERLGELFAEARVYVQVSRHEAFGYAVAEAMLSGAVPVVSRRGSLPELVGQAGLYVEPDDVAGLVSAIRRALQPPLPPEDPRARVRTLFSAEDRESKLLQLLSEVTADG